MLKEIIVELFRAVDSYQWEKAMSLFHPDINYERPGYPPLIGIQRLRQFYQNERVLASGEHHIEHIVVSGDSGACWGRFVGMKKDGSDVDELFADVYGFEDGKIKTRRSYFFRPAV